MSGAGILLGVLGAILLAGGLAAVLSAPRAARAVATFTPSAARAMPGGRLRIELDVAVRAPLPVYLRLEWGGVAPLRIRPGAREAFALGSERITVTLDANPDTRGTHPMPRLALYATDLLGAASREIPLERREAPVLVVPRALPLDLPELALTTWAEGPSVPLLGVEDPSRFDGVREYRPGDPLGRLHARSSWRHGRPMVKTFERVRATGVWVHVDAYVRRGDPGSYLEHAAELAASLLRGALEGGYAVGLTAGAEHVPLSRTPAALVRCAEALARLEADDAVRPLPLPPTGVNLTVITMEAPLELVQAAVRARARASLVHVVCLPEGFFLRPGERGRPLFSEPEATARLRERRALLEAEGVRVHVVRGNEPASRLARR